MGAEKKVGRKEKEFEVGVGLSILGINGVINSHNEAATCYTTDAKKL
jgi:hypothetical protein